MAEPEDEQSWRKADASGAAFLRLVSVPSKSQSADGWAQHPKEAMTQMGPVLGVRVQKMEAQFKEHSLLVAFVRHNKLDKPLKLDITYSTDTSLAITYC